MSSPSPLLEAPVVINLVASALSDAEKADRLADCLGLRDGSFVELVPAYAAFVQSVDEPNMENCVDYRSPAENLNIVLQALAPEDECHSSLRPAVRGPFAARYLLLTARALSMLPPFALLLSPWWVCFVNASCPIGYNPLFSLLMRTQRKDALAFEWALLQALAQSMPTAEEIMNSSEEAESWLGAARIARAGLFQLLSSPIAPIRFPGVASTTTLATAFLHLGTKHISPLQIAPILYGTPALAPDVSKRLSAASDLTSIIWLCLTGAQNLGDSKMSDVLEKRRNDEMWFRCEARRSTTSACQLPVAGMELSYCAKCKAVRHCSRAHQKADWKNHKADCIAAEW